MAGGTREGGDPPCCGRHRERAVGLVGAVREQAALEAARGHAASAARRDHGLQIPVRCYLLRRVFVS